MKWFAPVIISSSMVDDVMESLLAVVKKVESCETWSEMVGGLVWLMSEARFQLFQLRYYYQHHSLIHIYMHLNSNLCTHWVRV